MKHLIDISVKRPITVFMVVIAILIMGVISLSRLAIDFLPNIELPFISVTTEYKGAGPQEVEKSVTRLVESAVAGVNNIKTISSTSQENISSVFVEFNYGSDLPTATSDIREALDRIRRVLPDGADSPTIMKFSTDMIPIMVVSLYGSDDLAALYELADSQIVNKIEQAKGVARANLQGGLKRQVMVDVSLNRLQAYGLNINDIVSLLSLENQNTAGGTTYEGVYKYVLRTTGEFETIEDVGNIVVATRNGIPVRLRELAKVYEGYDTESTIVRVNGTPGITLSINKESGQNTVQVAKAIVKQLEALNLPEGVTYRITFNSATIVQESIAAVIDTAWQGALFAIIILMIYLCNFRTVGIIAASIPLSIITTFTMMYFSKITLNIVSLSGLALGIGMMVDNSIVVLENVFYYRENGKGKYLAAIEGTSTVALAISASTFTTVAVFTPFLFVEGMTGQIFRDLCLTVTISLLTSLATALTIVPCLSARMISTTHNKAMKPIENVTGKFLKAFDVIYSKLLIKAVHNKKKVIFITMSVVVVVLAVSLIFIGKEGYPETDEGEFQVSIKMPVGTRVEQTDSFVKRMEDDIRNVVGDKLEHILTEVRSGRFGGSGSENRASIRIKLVDKKKGRKSVDEYVEMVRNTLSVYPGQIHVRVSSSGMGGGMGDSGNIQIELIGNDLEKGNDIGNKIIAAISPIEGIREARFTKDDANPELTVRINRDLASKMGLNIFSVANAIKTGFGGTTATRMTPKGSSTDVDVVVKLEEKDRVNVEDVKRMMIPTINGMVPVSAIADITKDYGPTAIDRKDGKRLLTITASSYGRHFNKIMLDVKSAINSQVFIPNDFFVNYAGSYQDMQEAVIQLIQALILAIVLVYAIMASQFESLIAPFVIAIALPFGAAGALLALFITRQTLSVYSGIGIIVLVGIVINNGIVLIDYMNQLMLGEINGKKFTGNEAAIEAGPRRLRPVMMTSLTTILGLVPMAMGIGSGNEMYKPLAIAILGGLTVATVFTLVIVPVVYAGIRNKFPLRTYEEKNEASRLEDIKNKAIKDAYEKEEITRKGLRPE